MISSFFTTTHGAQPQRRQQRDGVQCWDDDWWTKLGITYEPESYLI